MIKHVPNILTIIRFLLIPSILYFILTGQYIAAFIMLTVSGLTDVLDGIIARKFNCITNFGKLIDPLADKATQISILATLTFKGIIPFWMLLIVFLKEFVMIAGASFLYGKELVVSSKWYGKMATVLFYIAIVCSFLMNYWNSSIGTFPITNLDQYIYYLALITTIFSLIMYFKTFYQQGYLKKENLKIDETKENKKIEEIK